MVFFTRTMKKIMTRVKEMTTMERMTMKATMQGGIV